MRALLAVLLFIPALAAADADIPTVEPLLREAHGLYFKGEHQKALTLYEKAARISTTTAAPWLNGAVVLEELGERKRAAEWFKAAAARTSDPEAQSALGWAQWRMGDLAAARASFDKALGRDPRLPHALIGAGRAALDAGDAKKALELLGRAREAAPLLGEAAFYEGQAYERSGDLDRASESYRQAVVLDSYFIEGRDALARLAVKRRNYREAFRQFTRILAAEPKHRRVQSLLDRVTKLAPKHSAFEEPVNLPSAKPAEPAVVSSPIGPTVPHIRVGIGTTALGNPRPREVLSFRSNVDFTVVDAATGRRIARGDAGTRWQARLKKSKKGRVIALVDPDGRSFESKKAVLIKPAAPASSALTLDDLGRSMRGDLEIAIWKRTLRLVNVLDLENYTHGVTAAEMPIRSPIEALKAQAIIARSHALFIRNVTKRHRKEGYDVCDEQHCQVYAGLKVESSRSREVVESTRGQIATYQGKVAHVIYSSNCGGHTQSGRDLTGWGDVPYWQGVPDAVVSPRTGSPWELRVDLKGWPQAYCQPSNDVHASHYRWTRVVSFSELDEKISRRLKIGRLKWLRALRRSEPGNVNTILVQGTKKSVKLTDEMQIRGMLGIGSLRSTRFLIEADYGPDGKPVTFVFTGAGWGHAVGLCQSGAMGRAHAGQNAEEIIKAYFKGVQLGRLPY